MVRHPRWTLSFPWAPSFPRRRESILCPCLWDADARVNHIQHMYHWVCNYQLTPYRESIPCPWAFLWSVIPPEHFFPMRGAFCRAGGNPSFALLDVPPSAIEQRITYRTMTLSLTFLHSFCIIGCKQVNAADSRRVLLEVSNHELRRSNSSNGA